MLICVKPTDGVIMAILHDVDMKLFRSMLHSTHCIHQSLPPLKFMLMKHRTSHCGVSLPHTTATITFTNIHSFYNVFLLEHINCLCCCLACYSLLFIFHVFPFYFNNFFFSLFPVMLYCKRFHLFYCISGIVTVCHFLRSLMVFKCQEIKGLLAYLLTLTHSLG